MVKLTINKYKGSGFESCLEHIESRVKIGFGEKSINRRKIDVGRFFSLVESFSLYSSLVYPIWFKEFYM